MLRRNLFDGQRGNRARSQACAATSAGREVNLGPGYHAGSQPEADGAGRATFPASAAYHLFQRQAGRLDTDFQQPRGAIRQIRQRPAFAGFRAVAAECALPRGKIYLGKTSSALYQYFFRAGSDAVPAAAARIHEIRFFQGPRRADGLTRRAEIPSQELGARNIFCHRTQFPSFIVMGRVRGISPAILDLNQIFLGVPGIAIE